MILQDQPSIAVDCTDTLPELILKESCPFKICLAVKISSVLTLDMQNHNIH